MGKWIGTFCSGKYSSFLVSGNIEVQLPDNFNSYPVNAFYRVIYRGIIGAGINFDGTMRMANEKEMSLTIMGNRVVNFNIAEHSPRKIAGTYTLNSPGDHGSFELILQ